MRLLLLLALCFACNSWSQTGNISGTVLLGTTESAIGATVVVTGSQRNAIVDGSGKFEIKGLPYGDYVLEFSSIEAQDKSISIVLNSPLLEIKVNMDKVDTKVLEVVTINNISEKKRIIDKGFAVNVIDTKEAALRNIQTNDLLDRSVGVRIRQNGGLGSSVDYNLNGMSGNSVRILIDGIPIATYGASFNLNSIPPALIERIEVYKGVVPAHLSEDALGGVINVVLKKGSRNMVSASTSYGSFNTIQSHLNASFRAESGLTIKASAFQNYSDNDYEVWGKFVYNILPNGRRDFVRAKRFNNMYRSFGGRVEVGFTDVKWADAFLIGYNGSQDFNEIQHGQFMTRPYKGRFSTSDAHVMSVNYAKKDFLIRGLEFTVNGVYSQRNEVINDTVKWNYNWFGEKALGLYGEPILTSGGAQQGAPTINHISRDILSLRAGLNYNVSENHNLIFSTIFNSGKREDNDELKSELEKRFQETRDLQKMVLSLAYEINALKSRLKTSLFGKYYEQDIVQRNPILVTQNGQTVVEEQVIERTTSIVGYGIAASYYLTPQVMILSSAEKAVRMPTDNEAFGSPGENTLANPFLRAEQSNNLNIGLRVGPFLMKKHKISVAASGFWRNTKDKIARAANDRENDAIQAQPFVNLETAQSLGLEASLDYVYNERLFISTNLSRFNSLYKKKYDNNGQILPYYNQQLPNEPFFTINGNVQYNFKNVIQENSELNAFYNCGYVHPFYTVWNSDERSRTPAQFGQDVGLSYAFPGRKFVVSVDARNIFDQQIYDNYAVQKPGRAFYLKLNYIINNF